MSEVACLFSTVRIRISVNFIPLWIQKTSWMCQKIPYSGLIRYTLNPLLRPVNAEITLKFNNGHLNSRVFLLLHPDYIAFPNEIPIHKSPLLYPLFCFFIFQKKTIANLWDKNGTKKKTVRAVFFCIVFFYRPLFTVTIKIKKGYSHKRTQDFCPLANGSRLVPSEAKRAGLSDRWCIHNWQSSSFF